MERNEYNGMVSVSLIAKDIRIDGADQEQLVEGMQLYEKLMRGEPLTAHEVRLLLPSREETAALYRYLRQHPRFTGTLEMCIRDSRCLARWESEGRLAAVVTQNIDGLHQKAGSRRVWELHGSFHRNTCLRCGSHYDAACIRDSVGIPRCRCGGVIKPDVVLYEEPLDQTVIQGALQAIRAADLLIVAGTSLSVYPAAGFLDAFSGRHLVVINRSATPLDARADLLIQDAVGKVLTF